MSSLYPARTIAPQAFSPKAPGEIVDIAFDFGALADSVAAPSIAIVHTGGTADATPAAMLSGPPSTTGAVALQRIAGGVDGARYLLSCTADAPDGQRFILAGTLRVTAG